MEIVADGLGFPEGPVALPDGDVVVLDVRGGRVLRVAPDGRTTEVARPGGGPNGAALGPDGSLLVVNNGGFTWTQVGDLVIPFGSDGGNAPPGFEGGWIDRVDLATGAVTRLLDGCGGERFLGPNDLVVDGAGGFWFTDFGKLRRRSMDRGALHHARADGSEVRRVAEGLLGPNGVGLSPDGTTVYVAETYTGRLLAWDLEGPGQVVSPRPRTVVATGHHFDSLAVEADGTVVVAAIDHGLFLVRPDGTTEQVAVDEAMTTNVCFAGPDRRTTYVTLSASGRLGRLRWPRPGLALAH